MTLTDIIILELYQTRQLSGQSHTISSDNENLPQT